MVFRIVEIAPDHGRDTFSCGRNDVLDKFCRDQALNHNQRSLTRVKVATDEDNRVVGFYSFSATSLQRDTKLQGLLGGHEKVCPALHLEMVAICKDAERGQLGPALIDDAFQAAARVSSDLGARCIFLEAADERLVPYYEGFGFSRISSKGLGMYAPIDLVRDAVGAN